MDTSWLRQAGIRFAGGGVAMYPPGTSFGPRSLRDFELVWIIDGDAIWNVDGEELPAPSGTLLLARPGMRDAFRWDPVRRLHHGFIHFDLDHRNARPPRSNRWPRLRPLPPQDVARPLLRHLGWLLAQTGREAHDQAVDTLRLVLAAFLSDRLEAAEILDHDEHPAVARAFACIATAWADGSIGRVGLLRLARAAGVSRMHLTRLFRSAYGRAPMQALRLARVERACSLLARTDLPIAAVATATGFDDPFHFSRLFRAIIGQAPTAYRHAALDGKVIPSTALVQVRPLMQRLLPTT